MQLKGFILLLFFLVNFAFSQVVDKNYHKKEYNKCTLIIAPILSMGSAEYSFTERFPEIKNPEDSLKNYIEKNLQYKMRKYAVFRGLYSSVYEQNSNLVKRSLGLDKGDSVKIALPVDGQIVKMILKGPNPKKEPDFILFLQIQSFGYAAKIYSSVSQSFGMMFTDTQSIEGISFSDFCWVMWDNKIGKIAAYEQTSGLYGNVYTFGTIKVNLFSEQSYFLDQVSQEILRKTPFSIDYMPYFNKN